MRGRHTRRKIADEVKVEKKRVCSTLNFNLDLSLLMMQCSAVRYFKCKRYSWSAGYGNEWFLGDNRPLSDAGAGSSLQCCTTSASVSRGLLLFDRGSVRTSVLSEVFHLLASNRSR